MQNCNIIYKKMKSGAKTANLLIKNTLKNTRIVTSDAKTAKLLIKNK